MEEKKFGKFVMIWTGEFISMVGTGLTSFGLAVYVYQSTGKATAVSLVMLLAFLPILLGSIPAGILADRFDRRMLMILGEALSALGLLFMIICSQFGKLEFWQITIGVTISSVFASLLEPAYRATITDMLEEEDFGKASGMMQLASSSKYLLSPIIAGFLIMIMPIEGILMIDLGTIVITVVTTLFVRKSLPKASEKKKLTWIEDLKEGYRAIAKEKGIWLLIIIMSVVTFFLGFLQTLFTPMILGFASAKALGILETVCASGMLFTSFLVGFFTKKGKRTRILVVGLFLAGLFMALFGIRENIYMVGIAGFLFFAALPLVNTSADCLIRIHIPNELQGRSWGLISIISQIGFVFAYGISGFIADNLFEPLFMNHGLLVSNIGKIIGVGEGRGIGFLMILGGLCLMAIAFVLAQIKSFKGLDGIVCISK